MATFEKIGNLPAEVEGLPVLGPTQSPPEPVTGDEIWIEVGYPGHEPGFPISTTVNLCGWWRAGRAVMDNQPDHQAETRYQVYLEGRVPTSDEVVDAARLAIAGYHEEGADGYITTSL